MRYPIIASIALLTLSNAAAAKDACNVDDLGDAYIAAFNSHDPAVLQSVLDESYTVTSPYGDYDRDGWVALSSGAWYAFPDMHWEIDQVVAEDDLVTFRYSFTGTFTNDFLGYTAEGQVVSGSGMEIDRYDEDTCKMLQTWNYSDAFNFLRQLE